MATEQALTTPAILLTTGHATRSKSMESRTTTTKHVRLVHTNFDAVRTSIDPNIISQIYKGDFDTFDYIFAMDTSNLENIRRYQTQWKMTNAKAQVKLFGEYSGTRRGEVVHDPYYSGLNAFEKAYEQCKRFSVNFLRETFPDIEPAT